MPIIKFNLDYFREKMKPLSIEDARELLFKLKCETEIIEDENMIEIEVNPDRPDMYSIEGIKRAVYGLAGLEKGWKKPSTKTTDIIVEVGNVETRPYIATAVVYNVTIESEDDLRQLIQFQEKLHDTIGRRRKKIAIGFHDYDKLPSHKIQYLLLDASTTSFKPLGHSAIQTGKWVLDNTEQGQKYGSLASKNGLHPFLLSGEEPIAMPPVLNSEITRIDIGTRNLFIDVTGTNRDYVEKVLDIIVTNLVERKNAEIGYTKHVYQNGLHKKYPLLNEIKTSFKLDYASRILGYSLSRTTARRLFESMRFNTYRSLLDGIEIGIPPFRADYISQIDLVEDLAMAIGYENLSPINRPIKTRGALLKSTILKRAVREIMIGLGFTEVLQLTLTSPRITSLTRTDIVEIKNPVQQEYSVLRPDLGISLLGVFGENQHAKKPVKIFEIGKIVTSSNERTVNERDLVAFGIMDDEVSLEDIQSPLYALLRSLQVEFRPVEECGIPYAIQGRCGGLKMTTSRELIAVYGEISPEILEVLGIEYPVGVAMVDLEAIAEWRYKMKSLK